MVNMLVKKVLILLTLVGTTSFAYPDHASLWGQRVFPDDENWLLSYEKRKFDESEKESNHVKNEEVCQTQECKRIADEFLSSLNKSVDPCNDFYDFACSGWAANDPIPPSLPFWSRIMIFQNTVHRRVAAILETKPEASDILPVRQAKKWYRSCMDTEGLEKRGLKPIESILIRAGGWPISMDEEEWDADENTWQKVEHNYASLTGTYTFYDVMARPLNATFGRLMITPQDLPLSEHLPLKYRNYSGNDYDEYVHLVSGIARLFVERNEADVSKEKVMKEAKEIVEFEKKLYELQQDYDGAEMTFEEFVDWYDTNMTEVNEDPKGKIDWQSSIQRLFDAVNIKIHPETGIYLNGLNYIKGIGELLKETPARTIVNYIHWNFVGNMLTYTTEALRDKLFKVVSEEYGIKQRPERWSECVNDMKMTHAAAYAFVEKYFTKRTETVVLKMIKNIQIEMEEQIENSNWLDEESKVLAKDKLDSLKMFVGFPDWYNSKKEVIKSYKGLNIGSEYFDNSLSFLRYKKKMELKNYFAVEEVEDPWYMDPITVNAMYDPDGNQLVIPVVDFQPPLFTPNLPDNVNYGITGVIVGHEMGHGFDDTGIQYGKDGNETKLSENVLKNYYQRADCFIDQFDKYYGETKAPETTGTTPGYRYARPKKSLYTRGENIADTTGVQAVFQAYRKNKKPENSLKLPGLEEFTDDQLFFLSFGAIWCEVETPEYAKKKKQIRDEHSPAKLRVIGSVSNTKDFAKAFNCPVGSPMNPIDKCNIWEKSGTTLQMESARMRKKHNRWERQWEMLEQFFM